MHLQSAFKNRTPVGHTDMALIQQQYENDRFSQISPFTLLEVCLHVPAELHGHYSSSFPHPLIHCNFTFLGPCHVSGCHYNRINYSKPILFLIYCNLYSLCHYIAPPLPRSGEWNHLHSKITPVIIQPTAHALSLYVSNTHTHTQCERLALQGHYSKPRELLLFKALYCSDRGK